MCAWGVALTYGSNYNSPTDAERELGAFTAINQARTLAVAAATERARALIAALATRHSATPGADRAALDRAYADAMRDVSRRFPDDLDAATLLADALMNLRPWSLWTPEGAPQPGTIYRMMYYPHTLDFVWHAAARDGRGAECLRAAREFAAAAPPEVVLEMPDMETAPAAPYFALVRFGRWSEMLAEPVPPARMVYVTGAWRYARGLALLATGRRDEAVGELIQLRAIRQSVPPERTLAAFFKMSDMLGLATEVLAGEIAARGGDAETAVKHLAEAVRMQDEHWFTEPPPWYFPVRQTLGAALLQAGRAAEAEAVYREDLRRNPENGWSLFGLAQSLRAQAKTADAGAVDARFSRAWARADVRLTSSRF